MDSKGFLFLVMLFAAGLFLLVSAEVNVEKSKEEQNTNANAAEESKTTKEEKNSWGGSGWGGGGHGGGWGGKGGGWGGGGWGGRGGGKCCGPLQKAAGVEVVPESMPQEQKVDAKNKMEETIPVKEEKYGNGNGWGGYGGGGSGWGGHGGGGGGWGGGRGGGGWGGGHGGGGWGGGRGGGGCCGKEKVSEAKP